MTDVGDPDTEVQPSRPPKLARSLRALGLLACLGAGIAVICVCAVWAVWAWVIAPMFGPQATPNGSTCDWLGACTSLSEEALSGYTGITLPAGTRTLASGRTAGDSGVSAYGLICAHDPATIITLARTAGYSDGAEGTPYTDGVPASVQVGVVSQVLHRPGTSPSESNQLAVGGSCTGGTRILLFWYRS